MAEHIPVLKLGDTLLVTVQVELDDVTAGALQEDLAARVARTGARGVLVDISTVSTVDSFLCRAFAGIAATCKVLDAATVVVGMRPAVAITMVELGVHLQGVHTALDVEKGMALLQSLTAGSPGKQADGPRPH